MAGRIGCRRVGASGAEPASARPCVCLVCRHCMSYVAGIQPLGAYRYPAQVYIWLDMRRREAGHIEAWRTWHLRTLVGIGCDTMFWCAYFNPGCLPACCARVHVHVRVVLRPLRHAQAIEPLVCCVTWLPGPMSVCFVWLPPCQCGTRTGCLRVHVYMCRCTWVWVWQYVVH